MSIRSAFFTPGGQYLAGEGVGGARRLHGKPKQIDSRGEAPERRSKDPRRLPELVWRFEGRIDQHQPAPLRRRQERQESRIAVALPRRADTGR